MTIYAPVPQCAEPQERWLELFRMKNNQNVMDPNGGGTPLGEGLQHPQTAQLHNGFSPCYAQNLRFTKFTLLTIKKFLEIQTNQKTLELYWVFLS